MLDGGNSVAGRERSVAECEFVPDEPVVLGAAMARALSGCLPVDEGVEKIESDLSLTRRLPPGLPVLMPMPGYSPVGRMALVPTRDIR